MKKSSLLINNIALSTAALLAGGITAAGNVASTLFTNASNRSAQESANQANLDLWREQTAYNNPTNQMQRLRQAGLNPDLMYGQNGVTANAASSAPQMLASQSVAPQIDPLTAAQIANINADTNLKNSQSDEVKSNVEVNASTIRLNDWTISMQQQLTPKQLEIMDASISHTIAETDVACQNLLNLKQQWDILDEKKQQEVINTFYAEAIKRQELRKLIADANVSEETYKSIIQQMMWNPKLWQSIISLQTAQGKLYDAQASLTGEQERDLTNKIGQWIKEQPLRDAKNHFELYKVSALNPGSEEYGWFQKLFLDSYLLLSNIISIRL